MLIFRGSAILIHDRCGIYDLKQFYFKPFILLLNDDFILPSYHMSWPCKWEEKEHLVNHCCLACHAGHVALPELISPGCFGMLTWPMVSYFTQLVRLGHTINHSSVATLHLWAFSFWWWIPILDPANISPGTSNKSSIFVKWRPCIIWHFMGRNVV